METRVTRFCCHLLLLTSVTACADVADESHASQPLPQLQISPANPLLQVGGTLHFQASWANGDVAPVTWQVDDPAAGTITPSGRFTSKVCTPVAFALVRAVLQADPSQTAQTQVTFAQTAEAFVSLLSITQVPSGTVAQIDSLVGAVDVATHFNAGTFPCRAVTAARLELIAGSLILPLDSIAFSPTLTAGVTQTFRWNTATMANGSYFLRVAARKADGTAKLSSAIPVQLRNP